MIAAIFLLFASTTHAQRAGLWMQQFMEISPNQWSVYQRKVEMVTKETGDARILDESPTLIAMKGLDALMRKDVALAKTQAALLDQYAVTRQNATWFEFRWDYSTSWPYKLKAPWISGLAQGLGLSLNTWLYQATKEPRYLKAARNIAKSYLVPIENGGFVRKEADGSINFEEYPVATPTHVLNGAALATLALQDFANVSGDNAYASTIKSAYAWWNSNIARYQVVDASYPEVVSAYSLAPHRNELLFRLLSDTPFNVRKISFKPEKGDPLTLQAGQSEDADRSTDAFLWFNPKFQNWSEPKESSLGKYRSFVPKQGEYNHAPFTFSVTPDALKQSASLELQVDDLQSGEVLVQLYTGKEYLPVGKIAMQGAQQTLSFPISAEVLGAFQDAQTVPPPVEPAYFTDNFQLVSLLGQAGHSPVLQRAARRFEDSTSLTPGVYDASPRTRWLLGEPM
ncbi:MAG: D-glucuronyl C5-epimerase family protein, partial [Pseudomonadales bacterium]